MNLQARASPSRFRPNTTQNRVHNFRIVAPAANQQQNLAHRLRRYHGRAASAILGKLIGRFAPPVGRTVMNGRSAITGSSDMNLAFLWMP
jgi:hypothetical protein